MSFVRRSDAVPAVASDICNRCHRLDIPCMINVGSRVCISCSRAKLRCRSLRHQSGTSARFRERLAVLRTAISDVLNVLDSVDLREDDVAIPTG
jgi:hypothetical protein